MNQTPSPLLVRKLAIDLSRGFARHWHGGDAFLSMYYNALSMSFPVGEQFFIDSVRAGIALLPDDPQHAELREIVRQFVGQEATHRHLHHLYNTHLAHQGLVNHVQHWTAWRIALCRKYNLHPLHQLAITAAFEHCTAVFADGTLRYQNWFANADPTMQTLWRWHAAEETEHKAVAFDLYQTLGGNYMRRIAWYLYVVVLFSLEATAQTGLNLWRDGSLFKPGSWWSATKLLLGRNGALWRCSGPLLAYLKPGFHPNDQDNRQLAAQWLTDNATSWQSAQAH